MRGQSWGFGRGDAFGFVKVRVTAVFAEQARCLDDNGNEYQVSTRLRMGRTGFIRRGDVWIITKIAGRWIPTVYRGASSPPLITAPRDGADRLTVQLLDALLELGLVEEEDRERVSNPD